MFGSLLITLSPFFIVSYCFRIGETSFYLYDLFFFVFLAYVVVKFGINIYFFTLLLFFSAYSCLGIISSSIAYEIDILSFVSSIFRYIQMLLFLYCIFSYFKNSGNIDFKKLIYSMTVSIIFPLAYSFIMMGLNPDSVLFYGRLSGFFDNPNYLSLYIVISIPIFNYILFRPNIDFKFKIISVSIFYFLAAYCLFFSGSISGIALSFFSFSYSFFTFYKFGIKKLLLIIIFIFFVLYFVPYLIRVFPFDLDLRAVNRSLDFIEYVYGTSESINYGSGELRSKLANLSIDFFSNNLRLVFVGVGLGQVPNVFMENYGISVAPHNSYIVLFLELGFFCIFFILLSLFLVFRNYIFKFKNFSLFVGYFLAMLATPSLYLPFFWGLIFVSLLFAWHDERVLIYKFSEIGEKGI